MGLMLPLCKIEQHTHRSAPQRWTWQWSQINKSSSHLTRTWDKYALTISSCETKKKKKNLSHKNQNICEFKCPSKTIKPLPAFSLSALSRRSSRSDRPDRDWKRLSSGQSTLFWVEITRGASKVSWIILRVFFLPGSFHTNGSCKPFLWQLWNIFSKMRREEEKTKEK